jgi:hypothetical protein
MDLFKAIHDLYEEKRRLDEVIAKLEEVLHAQKIDGKVLPAATARAEPTKRRGRKSMSEQERIVVSQRMKEFWAQRRQEKSQEKS